jgi:hypothetical protein
VGGGLSGTGGKDRGTGGLGRARNKAGEGCLGVSYHRLIVSHRDTKSKGKERPKSKPEPQAQGAQAQAQAQALAEKIENQNLIEERTPRPAPRSQAKTVIKKKLIRRSIFYSYQFFFYGLERARWQAAK